MGAALTKQNPLENVKKNNNAKKIIIPLTPGKKAVPLFS